jgi:threonine dehydratase
VSGVTDLVPTRADVEAAAHRIAPLVRRTPVLRARIMGVDLVFKLEHLQVTGSFKARGAANALLSLDPGPPAVLCASGGNHGLGVAHAAEELGIAATVVVPETIPPEKARRLAALGATVVEHGDSYESAEEHARELAAELGAPFIHPFADPAVVSGQGTVGLEVLADAGECDAVLVAIGGGGLIGGVATACEGSGMRVVGVEPVGIPTLHAALAAGKPVDVEVDSVAASALGASRTDALNLAIAQRAVDEVVLVQDADMLAARDLLWEACRLAVEPASAIGLAALLQGLVAAERPCVVLCGANTRWIADG